MNVKWWFKRIISLHKNNKVERIFMVSFKKFQKYLQCNWDFNLIWIYYFLVYLLKIINSKKATTSTSNNCQNIGFICSAIVPPTPPLTNLYSHTCSAQMNINIVWVTKTIRKIKKYLNIYTKHPLYLHIYLYYNVLISLEKSLDPNSNEDLP